MSQLKSIAHIPLHCVHSSTVRQGRVCLDFLVASIACSLGTLNAPGLLRINGRPSSGPSSCHSAILVTFTRPSTKFSLHVCTSTKIAVLLLCPLTTHNIDTDVSLDLAPRACMRITIMTAVYTFMTVATTGPALSPLKSILLPSTPATFYIQTAGLISALNLFL